MKWGCGSSLALCLSLAGSLSYGSYAALESGTKVERSRPPGKTGTGRDRKGNS